jgi:hypothetical protein
MMLSALTRGVVAPVVKVGFRMIHEDDNASNADFSRIVMEQSQLNTRKMAPKTQELEVYFVFYPETAAS